ncbi:MAG TPA: deoxyribonuclease V [Candidatus Acidoferrum sp.]|nr:deoxyribonuclease V [Candidatus Acidoferrum sp.]
MKALGLHSWRITPKQAVQIQLELVRRVETSDRLGGPGKIAGADIALDLERNRAIAGVIVYSYPDLQELERVWVARPLTFPYVPGLLSFREIPTLLAAFAKIKNTPDVIFVDGHGRAHPRRFGIASHLGVVLDCPTIGCAKSVLVGTGRLPAQRVGATAHLIHKEEVIAESLRTRVGTRPVYISAGHRVSLGTAVGLAMSVVDGYRIPKPTREADKYVKISKELGRQQP